VRIAVVGAIEVERSDAAVDLGGREQRALLAALVLACGRTRSAPARLSSPAAGRRPSAVGRRPRERSAGHEESRESTGRRLESTWKPPGLG
jgi:hypothetical protein